MLTRSPLGTLSLEQVFLACEQVTNTEYNMKFSTGQKHIYACEYQLYCYVRFVHKRIKAREGTHFLGFAVRTNKTTLPIYGSTLLAPESDQHKLSM
jgi:hypothetical protein